MADARTAQTSQHLSIKDQKAQLREGRIVGLECTACGERHFAPVVRCSQGHDALHRKEFATEGKVVSYTIQVVAPEAFLNEVPFAWVVVELDGGGPRVSGWIPFVAKPQDLATGQRVRFTASYKPGMVFEKIA